MEREVIWHACGQVCKLMHTRCDILTAVSLGCGAGGKPILYYRGKRGNVEIS